MNELLNTTKSSNSEVLEPYYINTSFVNANSEDLYRPEELAETLLDPLCNSPRKKEVVLETTKNLEVVLKPHAVYRIDSLDLETTFTEDTGAMIEIHNSFEIEESAAIEHDVEIRNSPNDIEVFSPDGVKTSKSEENGKLKRKLDKYRTKVKEFNKKIQKLEDENAHLKLFNYNLQRQFEINTNSKTSDAVSKVNSMYIFNY